MKIHETEKFAKKKGVDYKGEHFKVNPWAVCNKTTGGKSKNKNKFEKCVKEVKKESKN